MLFLSIEQDSREQLALASGSLSLVNVIDVSSEAIVRTRFYEATMLV